MKNINPVIILGANTIGKVALEILKANDIIVYAFLDDDKKLHQQEIDHISILGNTDDEGFLKLIGKKCDAFIAHDDNKYKKKLVEMLVETRKVMPINIIHPHAHFASTIEIGHGNLINIGAVLNTYTKIGSHNILNTHAIIEAEASLGDYVQVGAGSIVGAKATIEDNVFIGAGVVIAGGIKVGKNARIGAGSVVVQDVKPNTTLFGNPAKEV
jgi:sugar O-acyltransferase (sialic acid O-acetyltransferase NeuD family)